MTRKHFEDVADTINSAFTYGVVCFADQERIINNLADKFASHNPRFNRGRFYDACRKGL